MTEEDLKKTWCPYARVPLSIVQNIRGMAGGATDVIGINRNADGTVPPAARCIGRACSQFRERVTTPQTVGDIVVKPERPVAYCGAAGKP